MTPGNERRAICRDDEIAAGIAYVVRRLKLKTRTDRLP
jgi:hypothetical protein